MKIETEGHLEFNIKLKMTDDEIKQRVEAINNQIKIRQAEIKFLHLGLKTIQSQCKHKGRKSGYNERDGDWYNPCSICGSQEP